MRAKLPIVIAAVAAVAGFAFAATSTNDFVQHLDRQVHGLHCSFLPGLGDTDVSGESGCHVTLMSPYSSVAREAVWGGVPISLPAMAVFAFLVALALGTLVMGYDEDARVGMFTLAAWGVPVIASAVMGYIAFSTLDAACKLCIGIYTSSGVGLLAAIVQAVMSRRAPPPVTEPLDPADAPTEIGGAPVLRPSVSWSIPGAAFALGLVFVVTPVAVYAAVAPDFSRYTGTCGQLADRSDPHQVLLPIGTQLNEVPVIEVLDPLCPACRGFEGRLEASTVPQHASRRVLLFPLDDQCNWMLDRAIHPGACAISEAVLCADDEAEAVIEWAFENQTRILEASREDPDAAARIARERFPALDECIGSPEVQARLNQSLRWAVKNQLPILTPQVYVGSTRLCDADTDLGMDYALTRLVERFRQNPEPEPAPTEAVAAPEPPAPRPRPSAGAAPRGPAFALEPAPGTVVVPNAAPSNAAPSNAAAPTDEPTQEPAAEPAPVPTAEPAPTPAPAPAAEPAPTPPPAPEEAQ